MDLTSSLGRQVRASTSQVEPRSESWVIDSGKQSMPFMIQLPKIKDQRGNLTFVESFQHVPFEIKRVYYLYDVPAGEERGGHAHLELIQAIISLAGSFKVHLDNGSTKMAYQLNRPFEALIVPQMWWRELKDFSSGSVCLVLASRIYEEEDYIRSYKEFLGVVGSPSLKR